MPDVPRDGGERDEDWLDWLAAHDAALAHDFGNPLAGIGLALEMLDKEASSPSQRKYVERGRGAAERLLAQQHRWLGESRAAADCAPAGWHPLAPLSRAAWHQVAAPAAAGSLLLQVAAGAERVWCRAAWLAAALEQLFDNACRASAGGPVVLEAARKGSGTALFVRDAGPGIPSRLGPDLFRRRCSGRGRSPGLGLLRTRAWVARLGGRLCACVGEGPGAALRLWLPDP